MSVGVPLDAGRLYELAADRGVDVTSRRQIAAMVGMLLKPAAPHVAVSGQDAPTSTSDGWQETFSKLSQLTGGLNLERGAPPEKGLSDPVPAKVRAVLALIEGAAQSVDVQQMREVPVEVLEAARLFAPSERLPDLISQLLERLGKRWKDLCPIDPLIASRLHVVSLCKRGMTPHALVFAQTIIQDVQPWGAEIQSIVQLHQGLALIAAGKFAEASRVFEGILKPPS